MARAKRVKKSSSFIGLLAGIKREVDAQLSHTLNDSRRQGESYGPEVGAMIDAVSSLCERGGKRLRPGLCVVGALCVQEGVELAPLLSAGVALELLQAYFLIHDDWMDQDDTRRGGPTAHVSLGRRFRSRALGERAAILAGDHAVALAQKCLLDVAASPARLQKAMRTFAEMQLAAVAGQQLDIIARTKNPELTYELKTSSYTVTGPLRLGAELSGAKTATLQTIEAYGRPTGVAFQLADDLIGVFGDPDKTGKPRGADLSAGKNTPLVQYGKKLLPQPDRVLLERVLRTGRATSRQLERLVTRLDECGARASVARRISELTREGTAALNSPGLTETGKRLLAEASVALTEREA